MAGTGRRIVIAGVTLALGVAALGVAVPAAGASEPTTLPTLRRTGSARFVERTVTTREHRRVVLRTIGVVDFRRRLRQETTHPTGILAAESRTVGADQYYRGAPHSSTSPGRPWTHVRSDFVPDQSVEDPADVLRGLRPARPTVRRVGTTTVRGVRTTHYRITSSVPVAPKLRAPRV